MTGIDKALSLVTEAERDLYGVLLDEGLGRAEAFCAARSVYKRVLRPRVTSAVVTMHKRALEQRPAVSA